MTAYNYNEQSGGRIFAQYTTKLKSLLDNNFDLGLNTYPIFDESYRVTLNTKLINHYMTRDIGFETAPWFKFKLNEAMNLIMPLYNQYYMLDSLEYDLLTNFKSVEDYDRNRDDKTHRVDSTDRTDDTQRKDETNRVDNTLQNDSANSSAENNTDRTEDSTGNQTEARDRLYIENDTAQTNIGRADIDNGTYASQVNTDDDKNNTNTHNHGTSNEKNTGNAESKLNSNIDFKSDIDLSQTIGLKQNIGYDSNINVGTTEDYIRKLTGYRGITPNQIIQQAIDTFYNTDMMIITDQHIEQLFMGLFE